ncbi:hypothetical protein K493DRAFT_52294 [Basidiobolus meristosporus CBS 931.73]|uniref:Uncharacterized protein n=1 Tax=Basidiobolus meristosporus CBS 931.73 TaxID=1314790 RepID=A0A1Y1XZW7_9FUNG|nr:hypothetical protein K493DRAFT_52294 [Basidiobolus meristosporus CBS 931.73]|eukprot:ORX91281.1 hypothetical protein K493DRAFT_52294 [Basidiobolus meristosporus CBS 931.73]
MDDLNDLVWNTANSKPQPNPNGYGRISPSNNFNNKPLGSAFQQSGSSPMQKPGQSFGSYGKTSLNSPTNTFLSTSPRSSSSGQSIPRKTSLNKLNSDPFENLVNLGGSAKKNNTANLSLEEQRKLQLEKQKAQTLGSRCSSPADQQFWEQLGNKSPKPVTKSIPLAPSRSFSPSGTSPTLNKQQSGGSVDPFDDLLGPSTNTNNSNGFAAKNSSPLV